MLSALKFVENLFNDCCSLSVQLKGKGGEKMTNPQEHLNQHNSFTTVFIINDLWANWVASL